VTEFGAQPCFSFCGCKHLPPPPPSICVILNRIDLAGILIHRNSTVPPNHIGDDKGMVMEMREMETMMGEMEDGTKAEGNDDGGRDPPHDDANATNRRLSQFRRLTSHDSLPSLLSSSSMGGGGGRGVGGGGNGGKGEGNVMGTFGDSSGGLVSFN